MSNDAKTSAKGFDYASKIGSLIRMAEDETLTDETRAAYRAKAETLMRQYRIAEEETLARDEFSIAPVWSELYIVEYGAESEQSRTMRSHYAEIWREIARHAGVRSTFQYRYKADEDGSPAGLVARFVGFEIDVKLAEFLWTSARLVFLTRIDPRVQSDLSDQENAYYLRNSGMKRNEIAHLLWGSDAKDGAAHGRVQRLYVAECAKRGETPTVAGRGTVASLYREAYAESFVDTFGNRLLNARDAADKEGGAIEMHGRKNKVDEAFYAENPDERPMTPEERAEAVARAMARQAEREEQERNCARCAKAKTKCRTHRPHTYTQDDYRRWDRKVNSKEAKAGQANGAAAARAVNVQRTGGERTARTGGSNRSAIEG